MERYNVFNMRYIRYIELFGNVSCVATFDNFEDKFYYKKTDLDNYEACKLAYQKLYKDQIK